MPLRAIAEDVGNVPLARPVAGRLSRPAGHVAHTPCAASGRANRNRSPAIPGAGQTTGADVSVKSTAARTGRAGGAKRRGASATGARAQRPEPELVQLLTPEGERIEHSEYSIDLN